MPLPSSPRFRLDHRFARPHLSAYLDARLSERDRARVARHLAECAACRSDLATLRATVILLRKAPVRAAPRSFTLPPSAAAEQAAHRRWSRAYGTLRTATAAMAAFVVLLVAGDAFLGSALRDLPAQAWVAAPAAEEATAADGAMAKALSVAATAAPASAPPAAAAGENAAGVRVASPSTPMLASAAPTSVPAQPTAPAATGPEPPGSALAGPSGAESTLAAAAPAEEGVPIASTPSPTEASVGAAPPAWTYGQPEEPPFGEPWYGDEYYSPPALGGGEYGGYGGGGSGPIRGLAPTTGAEAGVAVPGTTGEGATGLLDPNLPTPTPAPTAESAAEPLMAESPAGGVPAAESAGVASAAAADGSAAEVMPAPDAALAAVPEPSPAGLATAAASAAGEPTTAPEAPLVSAASAAPEEATAMVAAPAESARPSGELAATDASATEGHARDVFGMTPHEAAGLWQHVRLGAALAFGVLLILLSGTVWTGYQRRS